MRGARSRLRTLDVLAAGAVGLRARRLRAAFSALGICIGIAAIVGVLGVTQSSEADLLAQIDRLGTNLLTVEHSQGLGGGTELPLTAPSMIRRLPGVQRVSSTATLPGGVYRTDRVPSNETCGIGLRATDTALLQTIASVQQTVDDALTNLHYVHFARFLPTPDFGTDPDDPSQNTFHCNGVLAGNGGLGAVVRDDRRFKCSVIFWVF